VNQLTISQIAQRRQAMNMDEQRMPIFNYDDSREFSILPSDVQTLVHRWRVNTSIVTFNAHRLRSVCFEFLELHEKFRREVVDRRDDCLHEPTLTSEEMAIALEFFLQIDCTLSHSVLSLSFETIASLSCLFVQSMSSS
jgi:hypothetical protein